MFYGDASKIRTQESNTVVTDGKWHFVSAVYDGYNTIYYVDGVNVYTKNWGSYVALTYTYLPFYIRGASYAADFPGLIDEVRIYNRALSADEVLQLYNLGKRKATF